MYGQYPSPMTMNPSALNFMNPSPNPYQSRLDSIQRREIIHVNGENGARSFRMAPNSQCLLLDDTAPIVWLATTDGAGYPSLTPYTISPYQMAPAPDIGAMNERLTRLEAAIYGIKPDAQNAFTAGTDTNVGTQPDAAVPAVPAVPAKGNPGKRKVDH